MRANQVSEALKTLAPALQTLQPAIENALLASRSDTDIGPGHHDADGGAAGGETGQNGAADEQHAAENSGNTDPPLCPLCPLSPPDWLIFRIRTKEWRSRPASSG